MATSSLGIGSGLDLNALLSKLIAAERAPVNAVEAKISIATTKISTFGKLKTALASLQSAASTLATPSKLAAYTTTSSDATVTTATTSSSASPGTYAVSVTTLAKAQKSFSTPYTSSPATAFGQGSLNFTINGLPQTVLLNDQASYSINEIRARINTANIGVTASVVSGTSGDRLVLSGAKEGSAGAFSLAVTSTPSNANLDSLATFDPDPLLASATATDAAFSIDGVSGTSSTNTFSTAINGVTLTLLKTGASNITVKSDTSTALAAVKTFVDSYNAVNTLIKASSGYDGANKTASPLNAESTVRTIQSLLGSARTTTPTDLLSATYKTLSDLGISASTDGSLVSDSSKLTSAIGISFSDVQKTLGAFGTVFSDTLTKVLATTGTIQNRIDGLNASVKTFNNNKAALQLRIDAVEKRYRTQFTALDKTVSSLQATSTYLTQQLARL